MKKKSATIEELRSLLRNGEVKFTFEKKDGTLRQAYGTLKESSIPEKHRPNGIKQTSELSQNFYDLEKEAWRSLSVDSIILVG